VSDDERAVRIYQTNNNTQRTRAKFLDHQTNRDQIEEQEFKTKVTHRAKASRKLFFLF